MTRTPDDPPPGPSARQAVTLAHIARLAGVSPPTVSKVINGHPGVSTGTRRRIEDLVREHGWRRPETAGAGVVVEVLFQSLDSLWALEIIRGIDEVVQARGMVVALIDMRGRRSPHGGWIDQVLARRPAGVIAVSADLSERQQVRLASRSIPLIALDPRGEPDHRVPSVGATNWNGGLTATRHLLELGHRRIAMVNGPDTLMCCRARVDGHRAALDVAGVPADPALLRTAPLYVEGGRTEAEALLALPDPPTAVFAANDLQALGVYQAAQRRGLRVPGDLSVVGFDDLPLAQWADPPMTTVRQPLARMGAVAAEMVMAAAGGRAPADHRVELATTLVVRASTATPR
ncbi:LacI family DNA-binding transcriptional regulator [Sphaerisporangium rubeum]|uniref:LacI family transcriptional regulator/LacI family xylobiose transport system transcriptional regulator n=1 Tax=Sphaerisporangium rubeum TaxID=321317 RepID=A0A7X0IJ83_9ACTN|nr:LacI family transcriptional regulator/LacI family xylobiose transport system transcriptional regulator [Sphaerisporangium rubeum]